MSQNLGIWEYQWQKKFHEEIKAKLNCSNDLCILCCRCVIHKFKTMLPVACSFRSISPPFLCHQCFSLDTWHLNFRGAAWCLHAAQCHGKCSLWIKRQCYVVLSGTVSWYTDLRRCNYFSSFQTFVFFWKLYAFFWVIHRRLNFICRRFGTLCFVFIGR
jgi:hypothetical protein